MTFYSQYMEHLTLCYLHKLRTIKEKVKASFIWSVAHFSFNHAAFILTKHRPTFAAKCGYDNLYDYPHDNLHHKWLYIPFQNPKNYITLLPQNTAKTFPLYYAKWQSLPASSMTNAFSFPNIVNAIEIVNKTLLL